MIPKDGTLIAGIGVPKGYSKSASESMRCFKRLLGREFSFDLIHLEKRESAAVPYSPPACGRGNVILVGDAAGFCNHFSSEGIRLAVLSGKAAGEAAHQAEQDHRELLSSYLTHVEPLKQYVNYTHELAMNLLTTDEGREKIITSLFI